MRFRFHPEARAEYFAAAQFYHQRQPGVELRFIEAVEAAIRKVVATPERWRILEGDVRRCLTRVFPYAVLYAIERDEIIIVAVMHGSREPGYWRDRLHKS